jgi:hypothetical protein
VHASEGQRQVGISGADRVEVHALMATLKAKVQAEAPPEQRDEAVGLIDELEDAIVAEAPKVRRMAFIRDWFSAHVPRLAGAVSELILSPLVKKIVGAAGDLAAAEFRNTFGP